MDRIKRISHIFRIIFTILFFGIPCLELLYWLTNIPLLQAFNLSNVFLGLISAFLVAGISVILLAFLLYFLFSSKMNNKKKLKKTIFLLLTKSI